MCATATPTPISILLSDSALDLGQNSSARATLSRALVQDRLQAMPIGARRRSPWTEISTCRRRIVRARLAAHIIAQITSIEESIQCIISHRVGSMWKRRTVAITVAGAAGGTRRSMALQIAIIITDTITIITTTNCTYIEEWPLTMSIQAATSEHMMQMSSTIKIWRMHSIHRSGEINTIIGSLAEVRAPSKLKNTNTGGAEVEIYPLWAVVAGEVS